MVAVLDKKLAETVGGPHYSTDLRRELFTLWRKVLEKRAPEAAAQLLASPSGPIPTGADAIPFLQAFSIWFQLLRIVDENAEIRKRRVRETENGPEALKGSFSHLLSTTKHDARSFAKHTDDLRIGPTLTAHPTEAKRVTVLEIHRRIYRSLVALETQRWTPRERNAILTDIEGEIELLWMTGELRLERPSLDDEIEWGLQFFRDSIFDAVPQVFDQFERAGRAAFGETPDTVPCIRFHSWIGGDRDGNPNVTAEMTSLSLKRGRETATQMYGHHLSTAAARLSISQNVRPLPEDQNDRIAEVIRRGSKSLRNSDELFRQAISAVQFQLNEGTYTHVCDFISDLEVIENALVSIDAEILAAKYIRPIKWRAMVFGFRTVTLDIRQNSTVTTNVLTEIWNQDSGDAPEYGTTEWSKRLREELSDPELRMPDEAALGAESIELLTLLKLIKDTKTGADPEALGPFILSMTRSCDDLLGVYLLARYAGFGSETLDLAVVPLFETIDDLRAAPEILISLLDVPLARRSLKIPAKPIEIMLGYSDSNKDGGFICSAWELDNAQRKIVRTLDARGVTCTFFHGRGGSVSRGGAPTDRAIASQPPETIAGKLRITEQGEVVSSKYANRGTAATHLELLTASVLRHSTFRATERSPEFNDALDAISGLSQTVYCSLIEADGFIDYFQQASPVEELAMLRIGSRPARRFGAGSLADLRAIPWVFAWSQNRHLISGWYGFGAAIESFRKVRGSRGDELLIEMFERSKLFRLMVDEVEKSLFQVDMEIGAKYASLVENQEVRERVHGQILGGYDRACDAVKFITQSDEIGARFPVMQERFGRVRDDLTRINTLQVELLRETRSETDGRISVPLLLSMNSIATALGWTG